MQTFKIGISPCPNDTFIFEAIHNRLIDCNDFSFEFIFEDVQTLNQMASDGALDIIKISYAHYFNVMNNYIMLRSGGALGKGVGPLLIAKQHIALHDLNDKTIAIPGINTTANFLLHHALPNLKHKKEIIFSDIEQAVIEQQVDAGVIIHENRFTYEDKGLIKLIDLGETWESNTGLPIPLGGIVIRRNLDQSIHQKINELISKSVSYAFEHLMNLSPFIQSHAQEMNETVMKQHIDLYVNNFSKDIHQDGEKAVALMQQILQNTATQALFISK